MDIRTDLQRLKRDSGAAPVPSLPATPPKRWRIVLPAVTAAVLTCVIAGYVYLHRTPTLTEKDTIVLADFENTTGDPVFDDTLRQGLSVELQQSPFLSLISDRQVQQQLALMGEPKEARLTAEVAQQICERTASAIVLEGSIASLGSEYVLGLRARSCNTGSTIVRGEALRAAHRYPEAAAEFQKVLDHRGIVGTDPIGVLAHLQLGRTFALAEDTVKAKLAYGDLFTLWKDADADTPILVQAKAEYARLP